MPMGAFFMDGKPRTAFFDKLRPRKPACSAAWRRPSRVRACVITSQSRRRSPGPGADLQRSQSGRFLPVRHGRQEGLARAGSRREWIDPERADRREVQPIKLAARDGMLLHGYLTLPAGTGKQGDADGCACRMAVRSTSAMSGVSTTMRRCWPKAGYAVLQLNYRGSGGYGRAFADAGAKEWGGKMQDDLTDATRWAIAAGHRRHEVASASTAAATVLTPH